MMNFLKVLLVIINIISTVFGLILVGVYMSYEIIGAPAVEKLLKRLNIPLNLNQIGWVMCICLAIMIISIFLRRKISGE